MGMDSAVLLVTDVPTLPATVITWAIKSFEDIAAGGAGLTVLTNIHQSGGKLGVKTSSVDAVISLVETPGHHTSSWLLEVARILKPGGDFLIQEPLLNRNATLEEQRRLSVTLTQTKVALERSLLLAGFVDAHVVQHVDGVGIAHTYRGIMPTSCFGSTEKSLLKPIAIWVKKPTWDSTSVYAIQKKNAGGIASLRSEATAQTDFGGHIEVIVQTEINEAKDVSAGGDTPLTTSRVMKVIASDMTVDKYLRSQSNFKRAFFFNEEEEFNRRDELLTMEDLRKPVDHDNFCVSKKTRKKCSCGQQEVEEKQLQTDFTTTKSCANCGSVDSSNMNHSTFKLGEKVLEKVKYVIQQGFLMTRGALRPVYRQLGVWGKPMYDQVCVWGKHVYDQLCVWGKPVYSQLCVCSKFVYTQVCAWGKWAWLWFVWFLVCLWTWTKTIFIWSCNKVEKQASHWRKMCMG